MPAVAVRVITGSGVEYFVPVGFAVTVPVPVLVMFNEYVILVKVADMVCAAVTL